MDESSLAIRESAPAAAANSVAASLTTAAPGLSEAEVRRLAAALIGECPTNREKIACVRDILNAATAASEQLSAAADEAWVALVRDDIWKARLGVPPNSGLEC